MSLWWMDYRLSSAILLSCVATPEHLRVTIWTTPLCQPVGFSSQTVSGNGCCPVHQHFSDLLHLPFSDLTKSIFARSYLKSIQMTAASLCLPSRKSKPEKSTTSILRILYYLPKK